MYAILVSAFNAVLSWVARSVIIKFVLYTGLWFVATEFLQLLAARLPVAASLSSAFAQQSPTVWYFLDLFKIPFGISSCLAALVLRFGIRRIPLIG